MGRGNVCVRGQCEGLYYIDTDDFHVYCKTGCDEPETKLLGELDPADLTSNNWAYDADQSERKLTEILTNFTASFIRKFPSFSPVRPGEWLDRNRKAILENTLFYIAVEDNEWSIAVELVQKDFDSCEDLTGFQKKHYPAYLTGMKECLLELLPSIGGYAGPWSSQIITS